VVIADPDNGHFYTALNGGVSQTSVDRVKFLVTPPKTVFEPAVSFLWKDSGTLPPTLPQGTSPVQPWQPNTTYASGTFVFNSSHYYKALSVGVSGQSVPDFPQDGSNVSDGSALQWQDSGTSVPNLPNGKSATPWTPRTPHSIGDVVADTLTGHFYIAIQPGVSGASQPIFPVTPMPTIPESQEAATVMDNGQITWLDSGTSAPTDKKKFKGEWQAGTKYLKDEVIYDSKTAHYYTVLNGPGGTSGTIEMRPDFPITTTLQIKWLDSGTTPPASVAGGQPADQVVNLWTYSYPQAHTLYYYNLLSGIVVSSVRTPTFGFRQSDSYPVQTGSNLIVDPVLLFTVYPKPFDAESPFNFKKDFLRIPGASFGVSLASPSNNFYFGGSSEILRNVQLVYGFNVAKISRLAPSGTFNSTPSGTNATPATTQVFAKGAFIGLTFNLNGFIQSLSLSGGGGGGGKSN